MEDFGARPSEPEVVEEQGIVATRPDSPVGRFLAKRGEGLHHVAFQVEDLEAALAGLKANGAELIDEPPRIGAGGTWMAYVHPRGVFGVLTELVELPEIRG